MGNMEEYISQVKFFASTKADLLTDKVNKWLIENQDMFVWCPDIKPVMAFTSIKDKGATMFGCMIEYYIKKEASS